MLLLVSGWGMSPATAGIVVTVLPLAAIAAGRVPSAWAGAGIRIASGVVLVAGGLTALALLPRAGWAWTIAPQLLVGAGIGLALAALTERALAGRAEQIVHGGWTLAARHAGVVLGLLLLAPVLTSALEHSRDEAVRAGAAEVLDSRIPPLDKLRVAQDVLDEVDKAEKRGELPDVSAALADRPDDGDYRALITGLQDQLDRAVTDAFSTPFLLAAAHRARRSRPGGALARRAAMTRAAPLLVALAAVAAVVVPYVALGGGSYEPTPVADPCVKREWRNPGGLQAVLEQVALSALDGAACELGTSREELVLALRDEKSLDAFAAEHHITRADAERAVHDGLERSIAEATAAGDLSGFVASLIARTVKSVPPWLILETLERVRGFLPDG